ncbi:hypothetical protein D770_21935 [Flammeovirgaceae bacterium 311]|nr:hypothetical protein D770_21935 [Flammeovirgaceae bacterium 311]
MLFLPVPPDEPSSLSKLQYYWEDEEDEQGQLFDLYEEESKVATLFIPVECIRTVQIRLGSTVLDLKDCSSFFSHYLLLASKEGGQTLGYIKKNTYKPTEGTISLQKQTYGWKALHRPDGSLMLMDWHKRKLFTYHYTDDFVRLMLSDYGRNDLQLIPLLCIGLYLLPIWHSANDTGLLTFKL